MFVFLLYLLLLSFSRFNSLNSSYNNDNTLTNTTNMTNIENSTSYKKISSENNSSTTNQNKNYEKYVKDAISAMSTEYCDWKLHPILYVRGIVCGKYYKILQLSHHRIVNQNEIKQNYYRLSKLIHPDKNPTTQAQDAFILLTESYQCLNNANCRRDYHQNLAKIEANIFQWRVEKFSRIKGNIYHLIYWSHHYLSIVAGFIDQGITSLWKNLGIVKISFVPIGQLLLFLFSFYFQRNLFYTALLSKGLVIFNTLMEEVQVSLRRRRENWYESMREYHENGNLNDDDDDDDDDEKEEVVVEEEASGG